MALERKPEREQLLGVGLAAGDAAGGDQAERDHGRARAEAARAGDRGGEAEREPVRRRDEAEGADAEMLRVGRLPALVGHLQLVPELERDADAVEAGADVRGRRRRPHRDPQARYLKRRPRRSHRRRARPRRAAAPCGRRVPGSLRPWPVITQTTREPGSGGLTRSPAMPAAEDGSQKSPSSAARSCQAVRICSSVTVTISAAFLRLGAVGGRDDPDRGGEGLGAGRRLGRDDSLLPAELLEPEGVGTRVAAASVRQGQQVGGAAELLDDLERRGLLALEPVRVERVDEDVRAAGRELDRRLERLVEAAAHLQEPRARRLGPERACRARRRPREQHDCAQAGARGVGGSRGGRVAGRRADDRLRAALERLGDRDRHPAVLEAARSGSLPPTSGRAHSRARRRAAARAGAASLPRRARRSACRARAEGGRGSGLPAAASRHAHDQPMPVTPRSETIGSADGRARLWARLPRSSSAARTAPSAASCRTT